MIYYHKPILLNKIIENLLLKQNSIIVDGTCGEGGHSFEIVKHIPKGLLICIDRDENIIEKAKIRLSNYNNVVFFNKNFTELDIILNELKIEKIDGILLDLGISMFHLKSNISYGISFLDENDLDMRLSKNLKISAKYIVNNFEEKKIADILYRYGEEYEARKIAKYICMNRPINNAKQLANIVIKAKKNEKNIKTLNPATKTFLALRIYVNNELENLEKFILIGIRRLKVGGRLLIISFHSLEDRIVKNNFKFLEKEGIGKIINKKPIIPDESEINENRSSRSAKLRIFEKLKELDYE